jgi:phospholipase/carboxylesterase
VSRRAIWAGAILYACQAAPPPAPAPAAVVTRENAPVPEPKAAPVASPKASAPLPHASLTYAEIMTGGADSDEPAPLVVALHGLGDAPERFLSVFSGFHARARVVAPHSEFHYSTGYTWFEGQSAQTDKGAPEIASVATTVTKFATEMARAQPTLGKPIVMGFSQGGALAFQIGVHHSDAVAATFPIGGWLTPALWPSARPRSPVNVTLFHGTADTVVPFDKTKTAVLHLQKLGFPLDLHEYPGGGHGIPGVERSEMLDAVALECERQRTAGPYKP